MCCVFFFSIRLGDKYDNPNSYLTEVLVWFGFDSANHRLFPESFCFF